MSVTRWPWLLLGAGSLFALVSCTDHRSRPGDGDGDADADVDDGGDGWEPVVEVQLPRPTKVDLLFVVDNSNSMGEEQEVLREQIRVMAETLIAPADPSDPRVSDLQVGVVSSDMGTNGIMIQTCNNPNGGDQGELQSAGRLEGCDERYGAPRCEAGSCPWLGHDVWSPDDGSDPSNPPIWEDFGCIATLGTAGCGFEQQLEASYQALVVQTRPGGLNEGFLRDDSLLAVVYVTDEDDCSTPEAAMFDPTNEIGPLSVRCTLDENQHLLYPIDRYHDAFVELRGGDEDRVVVAAIAGVPVDGSWNPGDPVEGLRELQQINPLRPNELLRSCETSMGNAFAPVRIVELVYSFGNGGLLASICRDDWTAALQAITRKIISRFDDECAPLPEAARDQSRCRLVETLADDGPCPHPADRAGPERTSGWQVDLGTIDEDGSPHRRCEILTADYDGDGCPDGASDCDAPAFSEGLQGWFYEPATAGCSEGRVRLTGPDLVSGRGWYSVECLVEEH